MSGQVEGARRAGSMPEFGRAEFGLKTLYDCGTAEVEYVTTQEIEKCPRANCLPYSIVAVHGLNGHRESTFTAANGICWLRSILPTQIPNIRVLSYGYDARTHSSSLLKSGVIATFGSGDEEEYYTDGPTLEPPDGS